MQKFYEEAERPLERGPSYIKQEFTRTGGFIKLT